MLNGLRMRLQALRGSKDQHLANLNAMIGREQELSEIIERLEALEAAGTIPKIEIKEEDMIPPVAPVDPVDLNAAEGAPADTGTLPTEAVPSEPVERIQPE